MDWFTDVGKETSANSFSDPKITFHPPKDRVRDLGFTPLMTIRIHSLPISNVSQEEESLLTILAARFLRFNAKKDHAHCSFIRTSIEIFHHDEFYEILLDWTTDRNRAHHFRNVEGRDEGGLNVALGEFVPVIEDSLQEGDLLRINVGVCFAEIGIVGVIGGLCIGGGV